MIVLCRVTHDTQVIHSYSNCASFIVARAENSSAQTCWKMCQAVKGIVSKETVLLRRWGSCIQKFGFINGVENVN